MSKFKSFEEAIDRIKDGDTVAVAGSGGGVMEPYRTLEVLEKKFLTCGSPSQLTLIHASGMGNKEEAGVSRFAHEGMVKRVIGGHWTWSPQMQALAAENKIEAYSFSQGVTIQLYREIAGGRPGLITKTGKYTYVDPRQCGGKVNEAAKEDLVKLIEIDGEEYLMYKAFPIDVAIIRGTCADEDGNISMEQEPAILDNLVLAQAAHNSGGIVIAQVKYRAAKGTLNCKKVKIPGVYVDMVVVDPNQMQTGEGEYNPNFTSEIMTPVDALEPLPLNQRKIVARRAFMELEPDTVINLGFGMSDGVASVAAEEGFSHKLTMTIEQGIYGGIPATGAIFGVASNPVAVIDESAQFDFYGGKGLDMAFLGLAQADQEGNVNVSQFGKTFNGGGGFIDISQGAKKVVYCGTFTAGGLKTEVVDGRLRILQEGRNIKLVKKVQQVTFSTKFSQEAGQRVVYVTERAVFEYRDGKLVLTEIAPGVDLERDVLAKMEFVPEIDQNLKQMDPRIFCPEVMRCK